ncbi:hypothetical protein [Terrabacter sp. NPDC080008]|uniref:hypothetical protein n=1 Tax=Terrabacter sp. NPDC080008 TaxID=3155176 RepID=UPI00344BB630
MDENGAQGSMSAESMSAEPLVCVVCGATPPESGRYAALTSWSRGTADGRTTWTCERCSRENIRSIEAKLDTAWW